MGSSEKRKQFSRRDYLHLFSPFSKQRTRAVVHPFEQQQKEQAKTLPSKISVYDYDAENIEILQGLEAAECDQFKLKPTITWINVDGLNRAEVEHISNSYNIHTLLQEDIVKWGQRPKMDEMNGVLFVVMHMLYFNEETHGIEQEQISIALTQNTVISFQEDPLRDVFTPIREKLKIKNSKIRQSSADFLFYSLIDIIVDSYFLVIEKLGERIEEIEEQLLGRSSRKTFTEINQLRKEIILMKRNTGPVRDLIGSLLRSDNPLLEETTTKYFKDVYDHVMQANDLTENYRDLVMSLQDLYLNNINLRMNEVMKTLAIATTVMAPATVIGGIFGMNFDIIPYMHAKWGFFGTVASMIVIPLLLIYWFRRRGWFQKDLPEEKN